jgi:hypothetical protein
MIVEPVPKREKCFVLVLNRRKFDYLAGAKPKSRVVRFDKSSKKEVTFIEMGSKHGFIR